MVSMVAIPRRDRAYHLIDDAAGLFETASIFTTWPMAKTWIQAILRVGAWL
jgi:hypothetical protein